MIRAGGVDPFTKAPRTVVECDEPGCERAEFAPEDFGPQATADLYAQFGWEGGGKAVPWVDVFLVRCPEHVSTGASPCPHTKVIHPVDSDDDLCVRCGARRPRKMASHIMSAAQLAMVRRRARLSTAEEAS